ncbi:MAG: hypothetical protein KBG22_12650 [Smithella sp.]|nr:hypothetical protein [Smithella sp.]
MKRKIFFLMFCFIILFPLFASAAVQMGLPITEQQYHEQIHQLWNQKKTQYIEMLKKSGEDPTILYNIQAETNNLLKYAGYCQKYELIDELSSLYLKALDTLIITDQYHYAYYPGSPRLSVHRLDKKYRMWVDSQKPIGQEIILESSQFLYLLSDLVSIIADIREDKRTPAMKNAIAKFIPLLIEHYDRWIFNTPGPFQVRGWGCRYNGQHVPTTMNHQEFLKRKLERKLGNGKSPSYCNAVQDIDMWIIAGVVNILTVYKQEERLVPITPEKYRKFLSYIKTGVNLLESRVSYTKLKNFDGRPVAGALLGAGEWDELNTYEYSGYNGQEFPNPIITDKSRYRGKAVGWDLSHARRFVHVFGTLLKSRDILGLNFPINDLMEKMANQLVYGTFNRDFKKPLFTNFMDGTNGWYRVGYAGKSGFGYGPWDMSISVLTGGYGFWSRYNNDMQKVLVALNDVLKSNDPEIRKHVIRHYETTDWNKNVRTHRHDFKRLNDSRTQSVLIQFLPSLCFINKSAQ